VHNGEILLFPLGETGLKQRGNPAQKAVLYKDSNPGEKRD